METNEETYIFPYDRDFISKGDFWKYYNALLELTVGSAWMKQDEIILNHDTAMGLIRTMQTLQKKIDSLKV